MNRTSCVTSLLSRILVSLAIVCVPAVGRAATVATPTFGKAAGSYVGTQSVTLSDTTSGATIYYTTNGTTPSSSSTRYTAAIPVSTSETIKAIAELSGDTNSAVASAAYTITVPTPTFSPTAGTYTSAQSVSISDATTGATIYYTTDGSTPTISSTQYTSAISVRVTETIKAIAVFSGDSNSAVASATYTIPLSVTVSPATASVSAGGTQQFTATVVGSTNTAVTWSLSPTTGAGAINTTSGLYTAPTLVTTPQTVTITATSQANTSVKGTATLTLKATPTLSVASSKNPSTYGGSVTFTATISSGPTGSMTFFDGSTSLGTGTISGTTATLTTTSLAGGSHSITANWAGNTNYSTVTSSAITQTVNKATPTLSVASSKNPSNYGDSVTFTATISSGLTGNTLTFYDGSTSLGTGTISGTTATLTTTTLAVGSHSITVKWAGNTNYSAVTSSAITQTVNAMTTPTPTISPGSGYYCYGCDFLVTISDSNAAAKIYYTTDGTNPLSSSTASVYTVPLEGAGSETVEAAAVLTGYANSTVATAVYTVQAAPPTFSLPPGSYVGPQKLTLSDVNSGNPTIYYTTNGTTPTTKSTKYTNGTPITISASETVTAIAVIGGLATSQPGSATYTITSAVATPSFSPAGGTYLSAQLVTINESSLNATIYYTIKSGTTGTKVGTSSPVYTRGSAITVSSTETLEAMAAVTGYTPNPVATATYTLPLIANSTTALAVTSGGSPVTSVAPGSVVTLTATVTSGATAVTTGTVNFCVATVPATPCTDIHLLGTAQLTSAGTAAIHLLPGIGIYNYYAKFVGTSSYATSPSSTAPLKVNGLYPTATTIAVTGAAGNYTVTGTVAGMGSNTVGLTGTVSLLDTSNGNAVLGKGSWSSSSVGIAFANVSTTLFPATADIDPGLVAVGDFNGDGIPDLAVFSDSRLSYGFLPDYGVTILLGNGQGGFSPAEGSYIATPNRPYAVAVGDFTGNGKQDLAVMDEWSTITILLGDGLGNFTVSNNSLTACGYTAASLTVADFNNDGKLDLAVACEEGGSNGVTILLGNGDGSFTQSNGSPIPLAGNTPTFIVAGDFNGDGISDLAVAVDDRTDVNSVYILLNNGDGTFANGSPVPGGYEPWSLAVGDFNGDGKLDLAVADWYNAQVTILPGNGNGTFQQPETVNVGNGPFSIAVGDFNQDGIPDLAVANNYDGTIAILLGNTSGSFSPDYWINASVGPPSWLNFSWNTNGPWSIAAGNFNGNGIPDLASVSIGGPSGESTVTILQTNLTETATATFTGVPPLSATTQNVEASYSGDANYSASASAPTPLTSALITGIAPPAGLPGTFVSITGTNFGSNVSGCSSVTFNGVSAQVTNWTPTAVEVIAPPESTAAPTGVTTGPVIVTTCNPSGVSNAVMFTVPTGPTITGLSPVVGPTGTSVTISGFNFGTSPAAGTVTFNNVPASPTSWGSESIIAPVPANATTGPVVVTVNGVTGNSYAFTVSAGITGIAPAQGNVGTPVTISGTNFGSTQGSVTFNGVPATLSSWSNTSIGVTVPSGATTGNVAVVVNGESTTGPVFTLLPVISSLSPSAGPVGTVVTVSGSNFGLTQGISSVAFGQFFAIPTQWSQDKIVVPVPPGAVTSSVVVMVAGQASNALPFTVSSSSPTTASITGTVTQSDGVTPIVGATITVLNGSNPVATAVTGPSGAYAATNLSAATYSVQASSFGFGAGVQTGISVGSGQAAVANFSLSSQSSISYTYDELGRLVGVADSIKGSVGYSYDAVGNIKSIARTGAGQVSVLDFTPKSGPVGTAVTVSGTSFNGNAQQDAVSFTGASATATSATSNQLAVTVPAGATNGPITVTTPNGAATSSASFTVTATTGGPTIASFAPPIGNSGGTASVPPTTVTIAGTGFDVLANDRVEFNGTLAPVTSATSTSISATVPANATSGPITIATPMGSATSSADFFVVPNAYAPSQVDFTGQISMGGSYTGTIVNGGDIGLVLFTATAGQQINLLVNGSSIASATISILGPGGSSLEQAMIGVGGTVLDSISAPTSGIYTVLVASNGSTFTGSLTLNLSQNISPTNPPGSTTTGQIVVNTPGQTATVLFYGTAGQLASVQISNSTFPGGCYSVIVSILAPGGSNLVPGFSGGMCGQGSFFVNPVTLPTPGTYTLVVAPQNGGTGSASVTLSLFNEQTIPVTPVAAGTTGTLITINTPGQDAQLTFTGNANQLASVQLSNSTFPGGCWSVFVSILAPDGSNLVPGYSGGMCGQGSFSVNPVTLPTNDTYTLVIAPYNGGTGSTNVTLTLQ